MAILRYNEDIQKYLGAKTKPEPWLHIVAIRIPETRNKFGITSKEALLYAIYVWDTRQVVEEGRVEKGRSALQNVMHMSQRANDNHEPLKGTTNYYFTMAFEPKQREDSIHRSLRIANAEQNKIRRGMR